MHPYLNPRRPELGEPRFCARPRPCTALLKAASPLQVTKRRTICILKFHICIQMDSNGVGTSNLWLLNQWVFLLSVTQNKSQIFGRNDPNAHSVSSYPSFLDILFGDQPEQLWNERWKKTISGSLSFVSETKGAYQGRYRAVMLQITFGVGGLYMTRMTTTRKTMTAKWRRQGTMTAKWAEASQPKRLSMVLSPVHPKSGLLSHI